MSKELKLGTPEAEMISCISLLSQTLWGCEGRLGLYLDLYYQTRRRFEESGGTVEDLERLEREAPYRIAEEKRRIRDRLDAVRAAGFAPKQIERASGGDIKENQVRSIIEGRKVTIDVYRMLDAAMDQLPAGAGTA